MNSWEKDAFRQRQHAELGVDTKRKGESTLTIPIKRTRAEAPSIPDKATVGEHCQDCGRPRHTRDECRSRDGVVPIGPVSIGPVLVRPTDGPVSIGPVCLVLTDGSSIDWSSVFGPVGFII